MSAPPSWMLPDGIGEVQRARIERDWKHRERRSGSKALPPVDAPDLPSTAAERAIRRHNMMIGLVCNNMLDGKDAFFGIGQFTETNEEWGK